MDLRFGRWELGDDRSSSFSSSVLAALEKEGRERGRRGDQVTPKVLLSRGSWSSPPGEGRTSTFALRASADRRAGGRSRLRAGVVLAGFVLVVGLTGCFRPSQETRALRTALLAAAGEGWSTKVELGAGMLTFGLARQGSRFLDLPPEARSVLRAVRGADVGVYEWQSSGKGPDSVRLLRAADRVMETDWERLVAVVHEREVVAVYLPREISDPRRTKACVMVRDGPELVVVQVRGNAEPLIAMALETARREGAAGRDRCD